MATQRWVSSSRSNIGNSTTQLKCISSGSYNSSSLARRRRRPFKARHEVSHESAMNRIKSPGSPPILSLNRSSKVSGKFFAMGEARVPSSVTLNQARPLAPKSCCTNSVSSSIPLREYRSPACLALIPRTKLPASATLRKTRNSASAAKSVQSSISMPYRRSGASCPKRRMASS